MLHMSSTADPLVPDSAMTTTFGLLTGVFLAGPIGGMLLGGFGLLIGYRLDTIHELQRELESLKEETSTGRPRE